VKTHIDSTPWVLLQAEGTPEISRAPIKRPRQNDARAVCIVVTVFRVPVGCLRYPLTLVHFKLIAAREAAAAAHNQLPAIVTDAASTGLGKFKGKTHRKARKLVRAYQIFLLLLFSQEIDCTSRQI
jgi:hypothetical protein